MRLGYCCINQSLQKKTITTNRGMIRKTFLEKGIPYAASLAHLNLIDLKSILDWNIAHDIQLFRMSSNMFPWMSEYSISEIVNSYKDIGDILSDIGDMVKRNKLRLTFHPDHFNVLASTNEDVVKKSIKKLNQHGEIMDLLGLPQTHEVPINIHVNTTKFGKQISLQRFCNNFQLLSESVKKRLVIENDDKPSQYTIQELYDSLYKEINTPVTFDYHHHKLNPGFLSEKEAILLAAKTWPQGIRQLCHYSSSKKIFEDRIARPQAHSDYIYEKINDYSLEIDVELEAKAKEQALLEYRKKYEV